MDVDAFHLPAPLLSAQRAVIREGDHMRALAPELSPEQLTRLCTHLADAGETLRTLPLARIIDAVDAAARRLREPATTEHDLALRALTELTGYSQEMAELTLRRACEDWYAPALRELVTAEFGDASALDTFVMHGRGRSRAVAPVLALHVFSGNVPGVSITSLVRSLLVRSAVIGKTAAHEPVLAPLFARALHDADSDVGAAVAVTYWRGGHAQREDAVLQHAQLVVHYGGAAAIASLRARAPAHVTFVEHGPRISFALIQSREDDHQLAAQQLADAVALFDQQGCVSPQLAYVVGRHEEARAFAAAVAVALQRAGERLPRGRIDAAEAIAIHEMRTRAEFAAIGGSDVHMWAGERLAHTVIYSGDPAFEGSCLNRTILVKPVDSVEHVARLVAPFAHYLQTAGVAGFEQAELERLASLLAQSGVTRVTPLSNMAWPPVTWHHDGRGPLRELVRWVDLET